MKQTRGLFNLSESGMACFQSQQQCHFWLMNLMLKAVIYVIHEVMNGCKNLKID